MKTGVEELVHEYDRGRLSRRDFVASLSALMLAPAATARAQPSAIEVSTLNHVSLVVSDVQRSTEFYQNVFSKVLPLSSAKEAEMAKLLENTFRAVNIGLVNELAIMSHEMGIDFWEVVDAASSKPFGFMPFYPGPGWGGHCIPVDPFYLSWQARANGLEAGFID